VQLSDPHIGASWTAADPAATLAAVVAEVRRVAPAPAAVVVTGDLADHATDAEYELLRELLAPLAAPVYVLAGNQDDRDSLRRHFGLGGAAGEPVQYSVALGALRLVLLDSTRPARDGGQLDAERLAWLDAELALQPDTPTVVAMHHPPLVSAMPAADAIGLPASAVRALGAMLARHRQVCRVIAGHLHRTVVGDLGGCGVLAAPSTYVQATLDLHASKLRFASEAPGFALHALIEGAIASHVATLAG